MAGHSPPGFGITARNFVGKIEYYLAFFAGACFGAAFGAAAGKLKRPLFLHGELKE